MKRSVPRTVHSIWGFGLAMLLLWLGAAMHGAYLRQKSEAFASVESLGQNLALLAATDGGALSRNPQLPDSEEAATLSGTSRTAATAELAALVVSAMNRDSLGNLVFTPEEDTTAVGGLRRVALRLRFEADTKGVFEAMYAVLKAMSLVRIDAIRVVASVKHDGTGPVLLSVDTRVSAWFVEQVP